MLEYLFPQIVVLQRLDQVCHGLIQGGGNADFLSVRHDLPAQEVDFSARPVGDVEAHGILVHAHLLEIAQRLFEVIFAQVIALCLGDSQNFLEAGISDFPGGGKIQGPFDGLVRHRADGGHGAFHDHLFPDIELDVVHERRVQPARGKGSAIRRPTAPCFPEPGPQGGSVC